MNKKLLIPLLLIALLLIAAGFLISQGSINLNNFSQTREPLANTEDDYPAEYRNDYINRCKNARIPESACNCAMNDIETKISRDEFVANLENPTIEFDEKFSDTYAQSLEACRGN